MSPNRRIFLNVIASYGRSIFSIVCGLFSTRWVLMALGQTDLGLYSVIGGMTIFISFFNILFAGAISRYFAFSFGKANVLADKALGLSDCRSWFNVAVFIHTVLPLSMMVIGYPIGEYAITHEWLEVPADRVGACVWVWRFTCFGCLVGMMNVPFQGMFTAKQLIAELTVYSVAQTAVKTLFIYLMVAYPGDWLARYAFAMMLITVVPSLLICIRAVRIFPECRICVKQMWNWIRIKQLFSYVTWQIIGTMGYVFRTSGVSILVNKTLGPKANAAMSIGNALSAETSVLSTAMINAFTPVLSTACGANDYDLMRKMAFRACRFGVLLTLVFVLPLALELDEVLRLWLKAPPIWASEFCLCLLACSVIEKTTLGHVMAVNASGRLAKFQSIHGMTLMAALPVSGLSYFMFHSAWAIGLSLVGTMGFSALCDVIVARRIVGMSGKYWVSRVVIPNICICVACLTTGYLPHCFMEECFCRIVMTTLFALIGFFPIAWWVVLGREERCYLRNRLASSFGVFKSDRQ